MPLEGVPECFPGSSTTGQAAPLWYGGRRDLRSVPCQRLIAAKQRRLHKRAPALRLLSNGHPQRHRAGVLLTKGKVTRWPVACCPRALPPARMSLPPVPGPSHAARARCHLPGCRCLLYLALCMLPSVSGPLHTARPTALPPARMPLPSVSDPLHAARARCHLPGCRCLLYPARPVACCPSALPPLRPVGNRAGWGKHLRQAHELRVRCLSFPVA